MVDEQQLYRDTWAGIDLDAIVYNMKEICKLLPNETKAFAAVKANGYGHGAVQIAIAALKGGAHGLLVAFLDEALELRKAGLTAPILVLGYTRPEDADVAEKAGISLTVYQFDWLQKAENFISKEARLSVHIKCDTGMNRIGIKDTNELSLMEDFIKKSSSYYFQGIYTHFATADQKEEQYYQRQLARFREFLRVLKMQPPYVHAANSAATLYHHDSLFNAIRVGISLYGLSPSPEIKPHLPFAGREAFSLHTKIIHIKKLSAGETIGYGATYTAEEDEWIATIPIGYADGWLRHLQGFQVIADNEWAPIVGRICMDQTMIKLPRFTAIGTKVTLIGQQGEKKISVDHVAEKLDTINYEVTCMISHRVPRIYV
ncbi:alanine racemase [Bacillus sp. SD088]|uniref:alanine racemase n=1 Tax=Bacillus sp. SD088 TaxID=2782012 RepID=UPI001A958C44|nr:alanine racemase [Bacillus sp. SD088]MBO0996114.1 alanine racemase [Bacillus sp. SD088]